MEYRYPMAAEYCHAAPWQKHLNPHQKLAYELIQSIHLEGSFYRSDIGSKAL